MAEAVRPGKTAEAELALEMFSHFRDLVGQVCWKAQRSKPF